MPNERKHSDYDDEPVTYCSKCYSLKIGYVEKIDTECCMECGCSDLLTTTIDKWEKLYESRYGNKFVNKEYNVRRSPVFNMSIKRLKTEVFNSPFWRDIIRSLYPRFPKKLSKADAVILLFDKVTKDKKLDDLRIVLNKFTKY